MMNFIKEFLNKKLKRRKEETPIISFQVRNDDPLNNLHIENVEGIDDLDDPVLEKVVEEFCDLCKKIDCDCLILLP